MKLIRVNLQNTYNTRDLGGYPIGYDKSTKWNKVYRSDCLSELSENDINHLVKERNVKCVIDLRSSHEIEKRPSALNDINDVSYHHISLSPDVAPDKMINVSDIGPMYLRDMYLEILKARKEKLAEVLNIIMNCDDGAILFNCTAGQDRTGVIAMLILGIVGVSKQDIATNYMQTSTNLKYNIKLQEQMKKLFGEIMENFDMDSANKFEGSVPKNIEDAYDHIINNYETFDNYLLSIGVESKVIDNFRTNFIEA